MRIRTASTLALVVGLAAAIAPMSPAYADRGRGADDTQQDDRGGHGADDGTKGSGASGGGTSTGGSASAAGNVRELRFVARMRESDGTTARARYQERAKNGRAVRQSFDVEIKFAQPGEQFEVRVDGRLVGTATAGALGIAKLELRRSPSGPDELPLPADFPRLRAGAVITVGPMQGTLTAQ